MERPTGRQLATFLVGPWMIVPQAFAVASLVGGILYEPPELHRQLERHIFLQGNTDWGGGCLFAGTVTLYAVFGFTAAWYLVLKLDQLQCFTRFGKTVLMSFWLLKFHVIAFVVGGVANLSYDGRVTPNDFRNMFVLAALIYLLSVFLIAGLHVRRLSLGVRLGLAPLLTVLWLVIGSDGNTARAGQLVQSGQDPEWRPRGARHLIMLEWHRACDAVFGGKREGS